MFVALMTEAEQGQKLGQSYPGNRRLICVCGGAGERDAWRKPPGHCGQKQGCPVEGMSEVRQTWARAGSPVQPRQLVYPTVSQHATNRC